MHHLESYIFSPAGQLPSVRTHERPVRGPEATLDQLLRLDSWVNPGLSQVDFRKLFAMCRCGLVMTRRVFQDHTCARSPPIVPVIDLTGDAEDSPSRPVVIDLTGDSDSDEQ
jgi:hypothetical protein